MTGNADNSKTSNRLLAVLLVFVCLSVTAVHWPCLSAKALCFDDNLYMVENNLVANPSLASAGRFFGEVLHPSTVPGYYQPFTMISLMLDSAMGGGPGNLYPYHRTSLILHTLNTALIATVLYLLFGCPWVACGVALLFGLHPLTVEPITWIGERKTVLASLFAFGCLVAYVRYVQKSGWTRYALCLLLYVFSLMSKPTGTPLPVVFILLDLWPLKRLSWRNVCEKIPFFAIGAVSAVITVISQADTLGLITPGTYGVLRIPLVFAHDIIFYLQNMVWPVGLTPHYSFPEPMSLANPLVLGYAIGSIVLITVLVIVLKWTRAPITGWLIFFVMILPTMQALQFSDIIASDKFVYLPSIGILLIIAWAMVQWWGAQPHGLLSLRRLTMVLVVLTLAGAEAYTARHQLQYWRDSLTLFTRMAELRPMALSPRHHLATLCCEQGRWQDAIEQLSRAIEIKPDDAEAHTNLGIAYSAIGRWQDAIDAHRQAVRLKPDLVTACNNLALLIATGPDIKDRDPNEAIRLASRACELADYKEPAFLGTLAAAYAAAGRFGEAVDTAKRAMDLADATNQPQIKNAIQYHLSFYTQGKPYVEPAPDSGKP